MSFFKSLASIGINRAELTNIANEDIIRIEKKLIAEQRLNATISKNDIDQILTVIKKYPDVISVICGYECFYGILTGYEAEYVDTLNIADKEKIKRIEFVVSNFFRDEIIEYINININTNNWNNLRVLLHYHAFLAKHIIEALTRRLEGKIEYALGIMNEEPPHSVLRKKLGFLNQKEFFLLLGEVDSRNFIQYILRLIDFMSRHVEYVKGTVFFDRLIRSFHAYDTSNRELRSTISSAYFKYGGQKRISYSFVFIMLIMIVSFFIYVGSLPTHNYPRTNFWEGQKDAVIGNIVYQKEEKRIKMEDFVEARLYPLNYPFSSWKDRAGCYKYGNPFKLDIFEGDNRDIKHGGETINIFNRTLNGCVAIAYFNQAYFGDVKKYLPINREEGVRLYAVYIPPGDSISVDFKMYLLRFYMGKRLAKFNTYRKYVYPDSADAKFSKFTRTDSLLFSKAFMMGSDDSRKQKLQSLTISQPNAESYQIAWEGESPIYKRVEWYEEVMNHNSTDSITAKKPLIFGLKHLRDSTNKVQGLEINSFLN